MYYGNGAAQKEKPIQSPYVLKQQEFVQHDTTYGGEWDVVLEKQVEKGISYVFSPYDVFGAYMKRLNDYIDGAVAVDGGVCTNETVPANEATVRDMTLMPAVSAANDAYYFGYRFPFTAMTLKYSTAGICAGGADGVWEYYTAAGWKALPGISDLTLKFIAIAGTHNISWRRPADWAKTIVGATAPLNMYWVRFRNVAAVYGTQPLGDRAYIGGAAECDDTELIKIEVRDPEGHNRITIFEGYYVTIKGYPDINLMSLLNALHDTLYVTGGDKIYIMSKSLGGLIDSSECLINLSCQRWKSPIMSQ